jgi:hypothetical protein
MDIIYGGGACTGTDQQGRPDIFKLDKAGTLFLDEIGGMPRDLRRHHSVTGPASSAQHKPTSSKSGHTVAESEGDVTGQGWHKMLNC